MTADNSDSTRDLGFAGMIMSGMSPADAYQKICDGLDTIEALNILRVAAQTPQGREGLECAAKRWHALGFPPPWEGKL